ncbi:hypothetical protein HK100_007467, partial [Physocladia obscura]
MCKQKERCRFAPVWEGGLTVKDLPKYVKLHVDKQKEGVWTLDSLTDQKLANSKHLESGSTIK